jgi:hypothetical protein
MKLKVRRIKMTFILSASRLMKAGEVKAICKEIKKNPSILTKTEMTIKNKIAASAGTLTA